MRLCLKFISNFQNEVAKNHLIQKMSPPNKNLEKQEKKTHCRLLQVSLEFLSFWRDGFRVGVQSVGLVASKKIVGFIEVIDSDIKPKTIKNISAESRGTPLTRRQKRHRELKK